MLGAGGAAQVGTADLSPGIGCLGLSVAGMHGCRGLEWGCSPTAGSRDLSCCSGEGWGLPGGRPGSE